MFEVNPKDVVQNLGQLYNKRFFINQSGICNVLVIKEREQMAALLKIKGIFIIEIVNAAASDERTVPIELDY
jgi:hypothetical protein